MLEVWTSGLLQVWKSGSFGRLEVWTSEGLELWNNDTLSLSVPSLWRVTTISVLQMLETKMQRSVHGAVQTCRPAHI